MTVPVFYKLSHIIFCFMPSKYAHIGHEGDFPCTPPPLSKHRPCPSTTPRSYTTFFNISDFLCVKPRLVQAPPPVLTPLFGPDPRSYTNIGGAWTRGRGYKDQDWLQFAVVYICWNFEIYRPVNIRSNGHLWRFWAIFWDKMHYFYGLQQYHSTSSPPCLSTTNVGVRTGVRVEKWRKNKGWCLDKAIFHKIFGKWCKNGGWCLDKVGFCLQKFEMLEKVV